jgi:hypothetical protein
MTFLKFSVFFVLLLSIQSFAAQNGKYFDRAIFVIFENTNYSDAIKQPFFKKLASQGANFTNFMALTHPSQGNYIALTSGSLNGVTNDNNIDVDAANVVDLLEAKGVSWKVYAEGFPGSCFTGKSKGLYARKHVPFISYLNIQKNPKRCANIVDGLQFDKDVKNGMLPDYVFYVPDNRNNGHDTGVTYADKWYSQKFSQYLNNTDFMQNTVVISTFDESGKSLKNQIYTTIVGPAVKTVEVSELFDIYSLLGLVEENWNLGTLGKNDAKAKPIADIWK